MSNLRQLLQQKTKCRCIRCREIRNSNIEIRNIKLIRRNYNASEGKEIFLSFENVKNDKILAFLRLRITNEWAIVRELHTYGQVVAIADKNKNAQQHKSLGRKLMAEAEKIVKKEFNFSKIAVISGIGVRGYYRKLGYKLQNTYMVKKL
jgi:elongator complex protein 3